MQDIKAIICKKCGKVSYPKRSRCLNCRGSEFEDFTLSNECKLVTYTKLFSIPKGVTKIPLILGIVQFKNGTKALGQIEANNLEIGMNLCPFWGVLRNIKGHETYGFKFKAAPKD